MWTNAAGGDWDTPGNWSTATVPAAADDAVINLAGITVTHSASNSDTVNSLTMGNNLGDTLALSAGTLSLASTSSLNNNALIVSGGTLSGAGSLSVGGLFSWTGGTLSGSGTLNANGGMTIGGTATKFLDAHTLTNAGPATWSGTGFLNAGNGFVLNNLAGATFDIQSDVTLFYSGGPFGAINNAGILRKSAGSGMADLQTLVTNTGTVDLRSGALQLRLAEAGQGAGPSSGALLGAAGTTLLIRQGQLTSTSSIAADQVVLGGDDAITVAGSYAATSSTFINGTATFSGTVASVGASLAIQGAVANFGGNAISTTNFTLGGAGTFTSTASLTVTGTFDWVDVGTAGGSGAVNIPAGAVLRMRGPDLGTFYKYLDGRTLNNAGTASLFVGGGSGGSNVTYTSLVLRNGAVINNSGTFEVLEDRSLLYDGIGAQAVFNNSGTFRKPSGTGGSSIAATFNNSGTVSVLSGGLNLQAGGTSGGSFTVAAGALLQFAGNHALSSSSSVTGAGNVTFGGAFAGGNIAVGGTYNIGGSTSLYGNPQVDFSGTVVSVGPSLVIDLSGTSGAVANFRGNAISTSNFSLGLNGTFTSTASLTVTGTFDWNGANSQVSGSGAVNIPAGAVLRMYNPRLGPTFKYLDGRTLNNAGAASLFIGGGGGDIYNNLVMRNGAVINNSGTFDVLEDRGLAYDGVGAYPVFNNAGIFRKSAGSGTSELQVLFNNSGTVNVQSGTLKLHPLNNTGNVAIAAGTTLFVTEIYTQTAGATTLNGGSLNSGYTVNINGGALSGSGTVNANVANAGQVSPGSPLGLLNIQGNYTQTAPGDLHILLGGLTPGTQYDQLEVANSITLGATLHVALVAGYMPHVNDTFTILKNDSGGAVAGTFAGLAEGAAFIAGGYQFRISYIGGAGHDVTLTVIKSPTSTSVNSSANASVYGQAVTLTATVSPPTGASTPSGTITFTIDGTPQAPVTLSGGQAIFTVTAFAAGSHAITAAYSGDNLFIVSNSPAFSQTVNQAPLSISADNKMKVYGASLPALTASYSGFVNGDTAASLTTGPTLSTPATAASHVGSYAITASGAVNANYSISYVAGTLSVTPASLTITANNLSKVYGAALPALTASYSGFVNSDTSASLTTQPTLSTTAMAASHVSGSPYSISASGAVDSDYTISYVAGTLSVTPAVLTITANNASRIYGVANPTFTASYSGFVNGDTSASLATQPTLTTTAVASSPVAGYPITASGAVDSDYTITYAAGILTITAAPLTATGRTLTPIAGAPFNGVVASFTNADPFGGPGSYTGQITWGDGHTSPGTIADAGGGTFTVSGSNTFATAANYTVHVQISHNLGYTTTATTTGTAYVTNEGFGQTQDIDY
jgi:hypothetical protein